MDQHYWMDMPTSTTTHLTTDEIKQKLKEYDKVESIVYYACIKYKESTWLGPATRTQRIAKNWFKEHLRQLKAEGEVPQSLYSTIYQIKQYR